VSFIVLLLILAWGRYYGFHISIVTAILLFGLTTYFARRKALDSTDKWIKTVLIALPVIVFGGFCFSGQQVFSYSPTFLFGPLLGIALAWGYEKSTKIPFKITLFLVPVLVAVWLHFAGGKFWEHYVIYETFSSGETLKKAPVFSLKLDSLTLTNADLKGKIVVLDFWNTSCPTCYRKFPVLKEKQVKWSMFKNIAFYSVNCPIPEKDSTGQAEAVLKENGISMTNLTGPNADTGIYYTLGIRVFPTTIILNSAGDVIFWGDIEKIDKTLEKELKI